jgi:diamine N-acetyltransferase
MAMLDIILRKANFEDVEVLIKLGKTTFLETFAAQNSKENMDAYLSEGFAFKKVKSELRDTNSQFYFAVFENKEIGYLKLNFAKAQTELQDSTAMEVERIYVLNEFQGKGIGKLLYNKAIEEAKPRHANYIWLGVWEENHKALAFYEKLGFKPFDKHIFKLGNDPQTDIMMKLYV